MVSDSVLQWCRDRSPECNDAEPVRDRYVGEGFNGVGTEVPNVIPKSQLSSRR